MANIFNEQIPTGVVIEPDPHCDHTKSIPRVAADWSWGARQRAVIKNLDALAVGRWFVEHYRRGAAERGHEAVARQLRKQGVPLEIAKLILLGRES